MTSQTISIDLSDSLVAALERIAELSGRSIDVVIESSISQVLPVLEDIPIEEARELATLHPLGDEELIREARLRLGAREQETLDALLDMNGEGELTDNSAASSRTWLTPSSA